MTKWRQILSSHGFLIFVFLLIYIVTVVPVGLFLYSLKTDAGWDVFKKGGYHTYLKCIAVASNLADMPATTHRGSKKN